MMRTRGSTTVGSVNGVLQEGGWTGASQTVQPGGSGNATASPEDVDFAAIMQLMTSKYTMDLEDRHRFAIRRLCKTCCNGFLLKHLEALVALLSLAAERYGSGHWGLAPVLCDLARVASLPFVSCKASDMITYGHHLAPFVRALVSLLAHAAPAVDVDEEEKNARERLRIEVAHTLACWARHGLDLEKAEAKQQGGEPLLQAVAAGGTPNLRILRQAEVMGPLAASFRAEESPEAVVIALGAIRDMSLYRPLAAQITGCGLLSSLLHVVKVNLLGSDVLLVAAEVLWNVAELDWEGASEALGTEESLESFKGFMEAVLARGYRLKDKVFRNDMAVLLMYVAKRPENRGLFAETGLLEHLLRCTVPEDGSQGAGEQRVALGNSQEDLEFRMLSWSTMARCCSEADCAELALRWDLVPSLVSFLETPMETGQEPKRWRPWSQEQRRRVQLEALSALIQLLEFVPEAFLHAQGCAMVLRLLHLTPSREVQRKCLELLQEVVAMGPLFAEELGVQGAVSLLVDHFGDRDGLPMASRQLCASILAGLCSTNAENCREFRKKDGIEALRREVRYDPSESMGDHLDYGLSAVDCVDSAVVGVRKNEVRFLDAGGLFALWDMLEVAPLPLRRRVVACLADLTQSRRAADLVLQWSSKASTKVAAGLLLEVWREEQLAVEREVPELFAWTLAEPPEPPLLAARPARRPRDDGSEELRFTLAGSWAAGAAGYFGPRNGREFREGQLPTSVEALANVHALLSHVGLEAVAEKLGGAEAGQLEPARRFPVQLEAWAVANLNAREDSPPAEGRKPEAVQRSAERRLAEERQAEGRATLRRLVRIQAQLRQPVATRLDSSLVAFAQAEN